jgi:hypothetical protein
MNNGIIWQWNAHYLQNLVNSTPPRQPLFSFFCCFLLDLVARYVFYNVLHAMALASAKNPTDNVAFLLATTGQPVASFSCHHYSLLNDLTNPKLLRRRTKLSSLAASTPYHFLILSFRSSSDHANGPMSPSTFSTRSSPGRLPPAQDDWLHQAAP